MEIHLRPELEALIRQDVQRGSYQTIEDYVEHAVSLLHEQEAWLAANRAEISAKIDEGYRSAQRGDLLEAEEVRTQLKALKQARSDRRNE